MGSFELNVLIKSLLFLLAGYSIVAGLAFAFQRKLQYFPTPDRVSPAALSIADTEEVILETRDGIKLINWYAKPNRENLQSFSSRAMLVRSGIGRNGFCTISKPVMGSSLWVTGGYGGSDGSPTERDIVTDGTEVITWLNKQSVPLNKLVYIGESLGSGVAVQVAAKLQPTLLILEAPFASAMEIGANAYPWLPVRLFMKDKFNSLNFIGDVRAPLVIIHGSRDRIVPVNSGRKLFQNANEPKEFIELKDASHNDLPEWGSLKTGQQIIEKLFFETRGQLSGSNP